MGCTERFHKIKDQLLDIIECELEKDVAEINTHELYEVIDMAKDMTEMCRNHSEYKYYSKVVEAMENGDDDKYLTSAHDPAIISRMYFQKPNDYVTLQNVEETIDSGADQMTRRNAVEGYIKDLISELKSINMTTEEKNIVKQHIAQI